MKSNCKELALDIMAVAAEHAELSNELAEHLGSCRVCREKMESLRAIAAIHRDTAASLPEPKRRLGRQQLESVLAESEGSRQPAPVRWRPILAGALALVLILGGAATLQTMRERARAHHEPIEPPHQMRRAQSVVEPTLLALRQDVEAGRDQVHGLTTGARIYHYRIKDVEREMTN